MLECRQKAFNDANAISYVNLDQWAISSYLIAALYEYAATGTEMVYIP
jgi:hypothetical protein